MKTPLTLMALLLSINAFSVEMKDIKEFCKGYEKDICVEMALSSMSKDASLDQLETECDRFSARAESLGQLLPNMTVQSITSTSAAKLLRAKSLDTKNLVKPQREIIDIIDEQIENQDACLRGIKFKSISEVLQNIE